MRRSKMRDGASNAALSLMSGKFLMISFIQTLAVAENLSFQRAALSLGTSQSSVSARIKALETNLGIVLFDRSTRGVRLTQAGRRFVDQVQDAIEILDLAIKTAGMRARSDNGEMRIGVHALTAGCFLDHLLERFVSEHPGVLLHLIEGTARNTQLMLRDGTLDIAFMAGSHEIADLKSRVIWRDPLMVALPTRHPLATRNHVSWREIAEETFLVRRGGTGPQAHDLIVARSIRRWPPPTIRCVDVERSTLLSMIGAGHGISISVKDLVPPDTPNVALLPINDEAETLAFSALWSPRNREPALFELLILAEKMGRMHQS
ncbi:LysR family transcriptional regulator [Brucella cytisi]|uniref:LysR family transcriptional regulator n=1 Tax=Brucella cytisi TaxID=407152 RepID=UPI0035E0B9D7